MSVNYATITTGDVVKEVTFTLDTDAYADGDILAATQEIADALRLAGGVAILQSLSLEDKSGNAAALDVVFLRSNTSIGAANAGENISDADGAEILTEVPILAGNYQAYTNFARAVKVNGDPGMGVVLYATSGTSLYIGAILRDAGGATYADGDLVLKIGLLRS